MSTSCMGLDGDGEGDLEGLSDGEGSTEGEKGEDSQQDSSEGDKKPSWEILTGSACSTNETMAQKPAAWIFRIVSRQNKCGIIHAFYYIPHYSHSACGDPATGSQLRQLQENQDKFKTVQLMIIACHFPCSHSKNNAPAFVRYTLAGCLDCAKSHTLQNVHTPSGIHGHLR